MDSREGGSKPPPHNLWGLGSGVARGLWVQASKSPEKINLGNPKNENLPSASLTVWQKLFTMSGADLRQKASSATLPERPTL